LNIYGGAGIGKTRYGSEAVKILQKTKKSEWESFGLVPEKAAEFCEILQQTPQHICFDFSNGDKSIFDYYGKNFENTIAGLLFIKLFIGNISFKDYLDQKALPPMTASAVLDAFRYKINYENNMFLVIHIDEIQKLLSDEEKNILESHLNQLNSQIIKIETVLKNVIDNEKIKKEIENILSKKTVIYNTDNLVTDITNGNLEEAKKKIDRKL